MPLRTPDPEQRFVLALVIGGVFGVAFMGYDLSPANSSTFE